MIDLSRNGSIGLDVSDEQAVADLSASMGVTRTELLEASAVIGLMPNALRTYFASKGKANAWPPGQRRERSEASAAGRKRRRDAIE